MAYRRRVVRSSRETHGSALFQGTAQSCLDAWESVRYLSIAQSSIARSMQRLSTGKRINWAADDAAGYAISVRPLGQANGLDQAQANFQDGLRFV